MEDNLLNEIQMGESSAPFLQWVQLRKLKSQPNPKCLRYSRLTYSHPPPCKQAHTILGFKAHFPSYCSKTTKLTDWTNTHKCGCHQVDDNHWHSNGHNLSLQNVPHPEETGTWETSHLADQPCSISGNHYPARLSTEQVPLNFRAGVCTACPCSTRSSYRANISAQYIS